MIRHIIETDIATSDKLGLMKVDDDTLGITEEGSVFVKPSILEEIEKAKEDILDLDKKIDKNIELLNEQINALDEKTDEISDKLNLRIDETQESLLEVIKKHEQLQEEIGEFDDKLQQNKDEVANIIESLNKRIDGIESVSNIEEIANELEGIKLEIGILSDYYDDFLKRITNIEYEFSEFIEQAKNVKLYGVKGDGATDDAEAIKAVLRQGGEIYFPEGEYHIYKTMVLYSNTNIVLHPKATIVRKHTGSMFATHTTSETTGYDGVKNVTIKGGTLIHNGNDDPGNLFAFFHAENITVSNMNLVDVVTGHCFDLVGSRNIKILNNNFLGCIQDPTSTYRDAIQIDCAGSKSYAIYDSNATAYDVTPTSNLLVQNNYFGASANNPSYKNIIGQHGAYELERGRYNNIRILDNVMVGEPLIGDNELEFGYCVRLIQAEDVVVSGNIARNFKTFFFADTGATVYSKNGEKIRGEEIKLPTREDMDNSLHMGCKDVIVKGNIIHCMDTTRVRPAIYINSSDVVLAQDSYPVHRNFVVADNLILSSSSTTSSIFIDVEAVEGCSILNNTVIGQNNGKETGFKASKGAKDVIIKGNNFVGISEAKKYVLASGLVNIQTDSRYVEVFEGTKYAKGDVITLNESMENFDVLAFHVTYNGQECRYIDFSKSTTQSIRICNLANSEGASATPTFGFLEYNLKKTGDKTIEITLAKSVEYKISSGAITPTITFDVDSFPIKSVCGIKY